MISTKHKPGCDRSGKVRDEGEPYTQCYIRALEIDPLNSDAWHDLGQAVRCKGLAGVTVAEDIYSPQQCFIRALEIDPMDSRAWNSVATTAASGVKVQIGGESYLGRKCALQAVEIDSANADAWYNLGMSLEGRTAIVDDEFYSEQACYVRCLELDPLSSMAWDALSDTDFAGGPVTIAGQSYSTQACRVRALEGNPLTPSTWPFWWPRENDTFENVLKWSKANCWSRLGGEIRTGETAVVAGETYSDQQCFIRALEIDSSLANAWYNLGITAAPEGGVTLPATVPWGRRSDSQWGTSSAQGRPRRYSPRQCLLRALTLVDRSEDELFYGIMEELSSVS